MMDPEVDKKKKGSSGQMQNFKDHLHLGSLKITKNF